MILYFITLIFLTLLIGAVFVSAAKDGDSVAGSAFIFLIIIGVIGWWGLPTYELSKEHVNVPIKLYSYSKQDDTLIIKTDTFANIFTDAKTVNNFNPDTYSVTYSYDVSYYNGRIHEKFVLEPIGKKVEANVIKVDKR